VIGVKYWELIADNLSKAGSSWGFVSAVDSNRRTIWIADAHGGDGRLRMNALIAVSIPARCTFSFQFCSSVGFLGAIASATSNHAVFAKEQRFHIPLPIQLTAKKFPMSKGRQLSNRIIQNPAHAVNVPTQNTKGWKNMVFCRRLMNTGQKNLPQHD
jgi:hypothetical protein